MPVPPPEPLARRLSRVGWLAGLPALALVWAGATLTAAPGIAARVEAEGARVAADTGDASGEAWLRVEARGRDLVAMGEAPDVAEREAVLSRLAARDGPRWIVSEVGVVETASPFVWAATRTGAGVALDGSRPVEIGRRALEARVALALAPGTGLDDAARAARGAPQDFPEAAAYLAARLGALAKGGRAALSDTVLSLSGEALDVPAYDGLRAALARPPEGYSVGRVEILPPRVADFRIALERSAAGLALDGHAPSEAARTAILDAAGRLADGGPVVDRLSTARGLPASVDPSTLIAFMTDLTGLIQSGRVAYADGAVSVAGDAIDAQAVPDAQALMRERRPAGVAAGAVSLVPRPLSPYRVSVRRTVEGVTVSGHLPDAESRARVLAALRPRLFREPLSDRTRVAEGAPPGLTAALESAAPLLASLATGEIAVSDRTLRLTGESLYRESAARASEKLAAVLPAGWSGSAAVLPRQPAERRDPETCREGYSHVAAAADIRFPAGSAALAPAFYPVLDALAALAKVCPSLRIAVSGPADPGKPEAAKPRPALAPGEPAAEPPRADAPTAAPPAGSSLAKDEPAKVEPAKAVPAKTGSTKAEPAKAAAARPAGPAGRPGPAAKADPPAKDEGRRAAKPESRKADEAEAPPADLSRQRALALVEYLLQAGARMDQVAPGPDGAAGHAAFAQIP